MKNYNGSHLSPSNNFTTPKLLSTTPLSNTIKSPSSSEETFTLKDLKHEYTKALSFIDKLKAEQNSIKNHLRMALDQQAQPASTPVEESYSPRNHSARLIKRNVTRDSDTRMTDLEIENSELKSQLDTALIRISKLQREKQTLQDHLQESEIQTPPNRELASEVRSLTSEVRTLKARLQEAEEENIRLSRQKSHDRISQKPSQSLIRYINYVSKLVSSMSPASFGRSCYEERFPKGVDVYELLESGQNEAVLLKAYKYITDLLININSVSSEESTFRIREPAVSEPISQVPSRYGSRRSSPTNVRSNGDGFSKKLQPSQDGFRPKLQFETLETVSTVTAKTPGSEEYAGYTGNEASQSSEYEQSRRNLQRIVGGPEENKGYKKPQKKHTRHSSSIIGGYNSYKPVHDSLGIEGSLVETKGCWDSRAFSYNAEEYNYSVKNRRLRDDAEIKGMEEEVPESSPALNVRPAKVERPAREVEEEEDREEKKRVRYRDLEVKENKGGYSKEDDEEEIYRSEFVKARVAGVRSDKDERREVRRDEGERRTMDGYGQIKKRARENNEEDYRRRYEVKEEEDEEKGQERIGYNGSKGRGFRSRSMPKEDEIIEETMESEKGGDVSQSRQVERKKRENRKRVNEENEEEDEDGSERNEVWERRREELARVNKGANANTNASANTSMELKGKDFNTFSVSFGRTESKKKVSLSPDAKTASSIMDVPRKKRVEHISVNYDVITGKEKKSMGSIVKKYEEKSPTVSFADEEGEPKRLKKKNSSMANLKKIVGDAENMG